MENNKNELEKEKREKLKIFQEMFEKLKKEKEEVIGNSIKEEEEKKKIKEEGLSKAQKLFEKIKRKEELSTEDFKDISLSKLFSCKTNEDKGIFHFIKKDISSFKMIIQKIKEEDKKTKTKIKENSFKKIAMELIKKENTLDFLINFKEVDIFDLLLDEKLILQELEPFALAKELIKIESCFLGMDKKYVFVDYGTETTQSFRDKLYSTINNLKDEIYTIDKEEKTILHFILEKNICKETRDIILNKIIAGKKEDSSSLKTFLQHKDKKGITAFESFINGNIGILSRPYVNCEKIENQEDFGEILIKNAYPETFSNIISEDKNAYPETFSNIISEDKIKFLIESIKNKIILNIQKMEKNNCEGSENELIYSQLNKICFITTFITKNAICEIKKDAVDLLKQIALLVIEKENDNEELDEKQLIVEDKCNYKIPCINNIKFDPNIRCFLKALLDIENKNETFKDIYFLRNEKLTPEIEKQKSLRRY